MYTLWESLDSSMFVCRAVFMPLDPSGPALVLRAAAERCACVLYAEMDAKGVPGILCPVWDPCLACTVHPVP